MEHALLFAGGGSCSHLFGGAPIVLGLLPLLEHALLFINSVLVAVVIAIDTPDLMGLIRLDTLHLFWILGADVLILGWSGSHCTPHAIRIGQFWGAYSFLGLAIFSHVSLPPIPPALLKMLVVVTPF